MDLSLGHGIGLNERKGVIMEDVYDGVQSELAADVRSHFIIRKKVWPTVEDALLFIVTELAEATELLLAQRVYNRNNPENKEPYRPLRFAEELGDVIYMAIVTGLVVGVDPVQSMLDKMNRQLQPPQMSLKGFDDGE